MGEEPRLGFVSIEEARARFEELLARAAAGEYIVISTGKGTAVRLLPVEPKPKRVPGLWKGKFEVPDSFFDPMSEEELALWYGDDQH